MLFFAEPAAPAPPPSTLSSIAQLCSGLAWPLVVLFFGWYHRRPITDLLTSVAALAKSATRIKIWEVEVEKNLDQQLDKTAKRANTSDINDTSIHSDEKDAAERVQTLLSIVPGTEEKAEIASRKIRSLAQDYESIRANMAAGPDRTREMNAVLAQMRTFALAAHSLLPQLASNAKSAGSRLAAVAMLQMAPDPALFDWLADRPKEELQPFIFYHASLALLEAAKSPRFTHDISLKIAIQRALKTVTSYAGVPDRDTIDVLTTALGLLSTSPAPQGG